MTTAATFTPDDLELLALTRLHPTYREQESDLTLTRWFDLRRVHPVLLTYRYAKAYVAAVKEIHAQTKDLEEAEHLVVLKGETDIFKRVDLLSYWRARQAADKVGVPYEFATNFGMKRAAARGWKVYPQPNQLYAEEFILDLRDAWERRLSEIFTMAADPWYLWVNNEGHPDQCAYRNWLLARCAERNTPAMPLSRCFREGHMAPSVALIRFDQQTIDEAFRLANG